MFRPRIIPVLLLKDKGLVKSIKYKKYKYIGDPINAVRIFNDQLADELVFLDIEATNENRTIDIQFVKSISKEADMPFAIGGGIKDIETIKKLLNAGAEKVIINTAAVNNPKFVKRAVLEFGSSTIVVSIDVGKNLFGKMRVYTNSGKKSTNIDPYNYVKEIEELGAGEIILNSLYKDGTMEGYDLTLIEKVSKNVSIPVVASCGAGSYNHFNEAIKIGYASAVAAGSLFVYHGPRKAVLINYPSKEDIKSIFEK